MQNVSNLECSFKNTIKHYEIKIVMNQRFISETCLKNNAHFKHGGSQYIKMYQNASGFREHGEH